MNLPVYKFNDSFLNGFLENKNVGRKQQNSIVIILLLLFVLLMAGTLYSVLSINDHLATQQDLEAQVNDLRTDYEATVTEIKESYDAQLHRMGDYLIASNENHEAKQAKLLALVEEAESKNDVQLEALRKELTNDFSAVIEEVIRTAVTIKANSSSGSGVIVDDKGHIVTNAHLFEVGESIVVTDHRGRSREATIVHQDVQRDLAVLRTTPFSNVITLGDSDTIVVGEHVISIGSPEGLESTVTQGIVSATNRVFDEEEGSFIQTDVPINSGSSGGPLINTDGELIGINTFKIKDSESLGFAIPVNDVKTLLNSMAT